MKNVNEAKEAKDLKPIEALDQLEKLFNSIPNPFQGSRSEVKFQNEQVDAVFKIIAEALKGHE
jgi:hypothetical protein